MANVALAKSIEEPITNPAAATDGQIAEYTANEGFAEFSWPFMLTVDLGSSHRLYCVRLLLWDGLGQGNKQRDNRVYKYRLLTSVDHITWKVIYDSSNDGGNGWQVFNFPDALEVRYVRVHGIWNSANSYFQIVQVEAHDDTAPDLDAEIVLQRTVLSDSLSDEVGDGMPLQARVGRIINRIERLVEDNELLNPEPFRQLISQLRNQVSDVASLERGMDSIRREIIAPVHRELQLSAKMDRFSVWGFWVGLVGGVLAIISLVLPLSPKLQVRPVPSEPVDSINSAEPSPNTDSSQSKSESNLATQIVYKSYRGPSLGIHRLSRLGIWSDQDESGQKRELRLSGRLIIGGCVGSLLYQPNNEADEFFVPDKFCINRRLLVRRSKGEWELWGRIDEMQ
jgi:hypothetical protein